MPAAIVALAVSAAGVSFSVMVVALVLASQRLSPRLLAIAPTLDDLVRLAFDQVRRHAASHPSFAVRLLELPADLRDAAPASASCREIDRQAELVADEAAAAAGHEADRRFVAEAYARLHAREASPSG